jgi:ABC-type lipoprotein release transport system permease subunit
VGVFDTGLDPLDRFTLYMPIQAARDLAGHGQNAPTANALVLRDGDVAAGKAWARDNGYDSATAKAFGKQYFGGILIVLDAVAIAASAAVLLVLALWILHDTAVVVGADRTMLAALRAVGVPLRSLVAAYMAPAAITALLGAAIAVLVAVVWSLAAPPLHLDAPGLGAELAWTLQPVQLLGPAAAVVLASAAAGLAARHIGRLDPAEALRPR